MKLNSVIPAFLLMSSFVPAAAQSEDWAVYRDSDCRVDYASARFTQDPLDDEETQRFSGPDSATYFRVKGVDNEEHLTPNGIKAKYLEEKVPGDIVYQRLKSDFLVLSGYRGDSIFYTKVAVSADKRTICILEITYPRKAKRDFDDVVTRMSRSLVAGNE